MWEIHFLPEPDQSYCLRKPAVKQLLSTGTTTTAAVVTGDAGQMGVAAGFDGRIRPIKLSGLALLPKLLPLDRSARGGLHGRDLSIQRHRQRLLRDWYDVSVG